MGEWGEGRVYTYGDVVEELGHVPDDVAVLRGLGLQQLLDHHHALRHHRLCGRGAALHTPLGTWQSCLRLGRLRACLGR